MYFLKLPEVHLKFDQRPFMSEVAQPEMLANITERNIRDIIASSAGLVEVGMPKIYKFPVVLPIEKITTVQVNPFKTPTQGTCSSHINARVVRVPILARNAYSTRQTTQ